MSKPIKVYTLNICNSLSIHDTSIKLLKNKVCAQDAKKKKEGIANFFASSIWSENRCLELGQPFCDYERKSRGLTETLAWTQSPQQPQSPVCIRKTKPHLSKVT